MILSLLGPSAATVPPAERQQAIICLLSASDGWREASQRLSGAFAEKPQGIEVNGE